MDWCFIGMLIVISGVIIAFFMSIKSVEYYTKSDIPPADLLTIIRNQFLDRQYSYNLHGHPKRLVTNYENYENYVKDHINAWNELFDRDIIEYKDSKMTYGEVSGNEFYLDVDVEVEYNDDEYIIHLNLYGDKQTNGDTMIQLTKLDVKK